MGPELTNQDIHIHTFPYTALLDIAFKIFPHKYFMKAFAPSGDGAWTNAN